jgi:hypothetical protein
MAGDAKNAGERLKVFISYSRRDAADFAEELVGGLELAGFAPFIDTIDIKGGEPFEDRIGGLIAQSDTVVFVITPGALKSKHCTWEVERTLHQLLLQFCARLGCPDFRPVARVQGPRRKIERSSSRR